LASKHVVNGLDTYSVEFDYNIGNESELPKAALVARKFKTNHHELKISARDTLEVFQELVFQYDEPFAEAANIPLYQLAKACSLDRKVILQGDGGDEIFAGYRRYNVLDWLRFWQVVSYTSQAFVPDKQWRERMRRLSFILRQDDPKRMAYYLTEDIPDKSPFTILSDTILERTSKADPFQTFIEINERYRSESRVQKMLFTDVIITLGHTYLEKVDKATMLSSVESRVPLLDNELTDFVLGLPSEYKIRNGEKKYLLKQAMKGILPNEILYGKKRGFDVPYNTWLRRDLNDFAKTVFNDNPGFFNQDYLFKILSLHKDGNGNYGPLLWKSLVLASWLNIYRKKLVF
jgi:asparagine synthase (glutamine-hydrolysing)